MPVWREQKCWNRKKNREEEVTTRRGALIFGTEVGYSFARRWARFRPRPGLLAPPWPQPEREKGHKERSPGMVSRSDLMTATRKTEQFGEKLRISFWRTENTLMFRLRLVTLNNAAMHLSPHYRARINEPAHGWLRLTWQLWLHCPRCFPAICWVHKKPACGIK